MKKILTHLASSVVINHAGTNHTFSRRGGTIEPTEQQIEELPEAIALVLVLLAGARRIYLEKDAYFAIREQIWTLLDREAGGLNTIGQEIYADDEAVMQAAQEHRGAIATATKTKKGGK